MRITFFRSKRCVNVDTERLVRTAKNPDTEIACPASPSLKESSCAMGVRRLTGKNSDATRAKAQSDMESTAPHTCLFDRVDWVIGKGKIYAWVRRERRL